MLCILKAALRVPPWLAPSRNAEPACACRLSYKGLGEPLCFTAFGPLALGAFYLAHVTFNSISWGQQVLQSRYVTAAPPASYDLPVMGLKQCRPWGMLAGPRLAL